MDHDTYKLQFSDLITSFPDYIHISTDGSKDGDRIASAAVCRQSTMQCRLPKFSSIFSAEMQAIMLALDFIESSIHDKFLILSDSLSSLQAINNRKFDSPVVQQVLEKCHFLSTTDKIVSFCWIPSHVGISGNERADAAATSALNFPVSDIKIPYSDLKQRINSHLVNKWQMQWSNVVFNKLQPIKPSIGDTKLKDIFKRRDELVLHRARLGHTYITHCYLLKGEDQPECIPCQSPLTVEHILLHCIDFSLIRPKYYSVNSLNELFSTVAPIKIINFLKEIHLYNKF